ncbi:MAG TPA: triacylglycerol lipase [Gemmatimonadaceae bacterium]|nr:triacylglycerol lipase [Gemmatimonadaceae bacterium]
MKPQALSHITLFCAFLFGAGCTDGITAPEDLCGVTRTASSIPLTHDPVLFVHGYGENPDFFCPMIDRFRTDGWAERELYAYNYSFVLSHAGNADEIRQQVDKILAETQAAKVDIIAHSAGSVSSRYYLKNFAGTAKVDAWVSLAGPNHGTDTALNCNFTPCLEIRIGSRFLADLNAGDETPGLVRYATWWSPCDETINPDTSVPLAGATNNQSACIAHGQFLTDGVIYQQVRDFVD